MLTKAGVEKLLRKIMETGGLTNDMADEIKKLKDELDEREGILRKYGEVYDGEDKDEYEWKERQLDAREVPDEWEKKYYDLKKEYVDRFFGTDKVKENVTEVLRETEEDVKRDGTEQTIEELFERREGDR